MFNDAKLSELFENIWKRFYRENYLDGLWGVEYRAAYELFKKLRLEERNQLLLTTKEYKKSPIFDERDQKSLIQVFKIYNASFNKHPYPKIGQQLSQNRFETLTKDNEPGEIIGPDAKLILINSIPELITNVIYLEKKLSSKILDEKSKAVDLIKKGTCFLKYRIDEKVLFAPSRFIGYTENSISKHVFNHPHGSITNNRIIKILGAQPEMDIHSEKEYKLFCKIYGITPNEKGNFGSQRKYWNLDEISLNVYGEVELPEGSKKIVKHLSSERNPRIRQIAIQNFLKKNKKLYCEACLFDFEKKYGVLGKDFIECHHTIPVSKMVEGHKTKPSDIVLLCSNCHRIIHRGKEWLSIEQLKAIIQSN